MNVVSYGGGVNSTALLILMNKKKIPIHNIIFADTGAEMPKTYEYIPIIKRWCKERGYKFTTVKSDLGKLYDHYFKNKIIPFRMFRHCTHKFKVRPIEKYLKKYEEYTLFMGIDAGEAHRAKHDKYKYPLITYGVGRQGCKELIRAAGLPVPVKSGCFVCPFMPYNEYKRLFFERYDLFKKARKLEENNRRYPEFTIIKDHSLKKIENAFKNQTQLIINDPVGGCVCGFCNT